MRDISWACGLFEGEGTILVRKRPEDQIAVSLSNTDEDVVREFCAIVGCGRVYGPYQYGGKKPYWKWNADGSNAAAVLTTFLPDLCARRKNKAEEALIRLEDRQNRPHYTVSRKGMGGRPTHDYYARAVEKPDLPYRPIAAKPELPSRAISFPDPERLADR